MRDYPEAIVPVDHVEPVPRRIRGFVDGAVVFDTTRALYVWEWPMYPHYYIPIADVDAAALVDEDHVEKLRRGSARRLSLRVGNDERRSAGRVFTESTIDALNGYVRFDWGALDAWFEEDEQVFVHPRDPYSHIDVLRSTRSIRIEIDGVVLAESSSPVMLFETGLPTRYYLNRTEVALSRLSPSETVTSCPYKGTTSGYWSARVGGTEHEDIAWTYDFPTRQVEPIAGLIAFYNEKVDVMLDGQLLERPQTHFKK